MVFFDPRLWLAGIAAGALIIGVAYAVVNL